MNGTVVRFTPRPPDAPRPPSGPRVRALKGPSVASLEWARKLDLLRKKDQRMASIAERFVDASLL
jgi:hypothetical protein